jgi:phosphoglucosamine mutase
MRVLFGTDGVRGPANIEPMTGETVMKLGRAAAAMFQNGGGGRHRIVIGKDTRLSGYMLESALTCGICSTGVDVLLIGPIPTPAIAFLTRSLRADAGVMISASHNPFQDNGIKFFSKYGLKLPDDAEREIERRMAEDRPDAVRPTAAAIGKAYRVDDAEGRYIEFVKNTLPKGLDFQGMKVVVDAANGAAYKVTPTVLRELGAQVTLINATPDGLNINRDCGAIYPEQLQDRVMACGADIGIAHDGDADRVLFVDEKGRVVDGDAVLVAFALALHRQGTLQGKTLVTTLMSNMGVDLALRPAGIEVVRTAVGDRYVLERMLTDHYNLGGEPSGHVIFLDHNTTGDGLITALQFLALMQKTGQSASHLAACMNPLPQCCVNVEVSRKPAISDIPGMEGAMADCERRLRGRGRLLVRYSGTESLLRIMIEGENQDSISEMATQLSDIIQQNIGRTSP